MRRSDRERLPWLVVGVLAGGAISLWAFDGGVIRVVGTLVGMAVGCAIGWLGHALVQGTGRSN